MLATPLVTLRGYMTEPTLAQPTRRWLGLRAATRRVGLKSHAYMLRLVPRMTAEGVTILRPTEGVILIDEGELVAWWQSWHPEWTDPEG